MEAVGVGAEVKVEVAMAVVWVEVAREEDACIRASSKLDLRGNVVRSAC